MSTPNSPFNQFLFGFFGFLFLSIIYCLSPSPKLWACLGLLQLHDIADTRSLWGIPSFLNILSSFLLSLVCVFWLCWLIHQKKKADKVVLSALEYFLYLTFFMTLLAAGIGFIIYHWMPLDSASHIWGQFPTTIAVMSFVIALITPKISRFNHSSILVLYFVVIGGTGFIYYHNNNYQIALVDTNHLPNLNYTLPALFYIFFTLASPQKHLKLKYIFFSCLSFNIALVMAIHDHMIYRITKGMISGLSLKYFYLGMAAIYTGCYLRDQFRSHQQMNIGSLKFAKN